MANANIPFLLQFNVDLIIGAIIRKAGTPAAEAAKAKEVLAVCAALTQINAGDVTAGLPALDAALSSSAASDPGEAAAMQTAISWLATKASALQSIGQGTLLGTINTDILNSVIAETQNVANAYIAAAPTTPAA